MNMLKGDRKYWETYDDGIAFYRYGVKAIWFMFAVLKNWVVLFILFLQLGKKSKKHIEYSRKCRVSIAYFKLYQEELFKM